MLVVLAYKHFLLDMGAHGLAVLGDGFEESRHHEQEPVHAPLGEVPAVFVADRRTKPSERSQFAPKAAEESGTVTTQCPDPVQAKAKHFDQQTIAHLVGMGDRKS